MELGLCESESTLDMIPCQFTLVLAMMREFRVFCSHVDVNFLISPSNEICLDDWTIYRPSINHLLFCYVGRSDQLSPPLPFP